jgi:hypothetical protein
MMVIAHLLGFALIFIACTFDFMRLALMPEKNPVFPRYSFADHCCLAHHLLRHLGAWLEELWQ